MPGGAPGKDGRGKPQDQEAPAFQGLRGCPTYQLCDLGLIIPSPCLSSFLFQMGR